MPPQPFRPCPTPRGPCLTGDWALPFLHEVVRKGALLHASPPGHGARSVRSVRSLSKSESGSIPVLVGTWPSWTAQTSLPSCVNTAIIRLRYPVSRVRIPYPASIRYRGRSRPRPRSCFAMDLFGQTLPTPWPSRKRRRALCASARGHPDAASFPDNLWPFPVAMSPVSPQNAHPDL